MITLSQSQINLISERINEKLELIPKVIKQAHERIIGARRVVNGNKILNAHQTDIHLMIRGKASGEVVPRNFVTTIAKRPFGNGLCLVEIPDGFIFEYELYQQQTPSDSEQLVENLQRLSRLQLDQKS